MNKTEIIDNYNITYKKHIFSKNIKISLKSKDFILVTMPIKCPYRAAREFLLFNLDKIKSFNLEEKKYDENLSTKFDTLKIIKSDKTETVQKSGVVYFYYSGDILNSNNQKALYDAYIKALKIEAKNYLPFRLRFLAEKYGYNYNKLALKFQKTRFGSCSFQNNINLNIILMKHDFDVIDYVILHELAHTKIKNHSKKFWEEVERNCPNYRLLRQKLKSF